MSARDPAAAGLGRLGPMRSLLDAPSPAVLTTRKQDGSAFVTPVWYRFVDGAFEVVIAVGDVKLRHLRRDPRCALLVFETARPFRGVEACGIAELIEGDVTSARAAIAARYLGERNGRRFAADRASVPGVLVRLTDETPRSWDLSGMLPS